MNPQALFTHARRNLQELASGKFVVVDEHHDEKVLGSRYVTFHRAPESLRLSWDGKADFLVLEWAPNQEQASLKMWEDVALWRYPRTEQSDERAREILAQLSAEFSTCLSQSGV